jgi:hypothetical protein
LLCSVEGSAGPHYPKQFFWAKATDSAHEM